MLKQIGAYFIDAGTILMMFIKASWGQTIGSLLVTIGTALEQGQGSIGPITVPGLQTFAPYFIDAGTLLTLVFKAAWAQSVGSFLTTLGLAVQIGQGSGGPVRIDDVGVTFTITNGDQISFTFAPWKNA